MRRKRYLYRNSLSANIYCLFYAIEKKSLPRNTFVFRLKLWFAYLLIIPLGIILLPAVLFEYKEYRQGLFHYGNVPMAERFVMSLLVYLGFLGITIVLLPFGLIFTSYTSVLFNMLCNLGLIFWGLVVIRYVFKVLRKLIVLVYKAIVTSKPIQMLERVADIEWQKPVPDRVREISDIMRTEETKFLTQRGWIEVEGPEDETRWIKQPYLQEPMTFDDAYKFERKLFVHERVNERKKKNND